jgi:hypothetical protein
MTAGVHDAHQTGLIGPVAFFGGFLLLLASPIMRGGNRYIALIPLEFIALGLLFALCVDVATRSVADRVPTRISPLVLLLAASPLLLAVLQLVPVPPAVWMRVPGHSVYVETLSAIGAVADISRPLSISPAATKASLLAGVLPAGVLLLAYLASLSQLRKLMWVVVAVAFAEVLFGLVQISSGPSSAPFFGAVTYGPPVGTFANRNHFANYIAMALVGYLWLAYESNRGAATRRERNSFGSAHKAGAWAAGGVVLVLGILMSRSRGAALFGLPMALLGLGVVSLRIVGWKRGWRYAVAIALLLLLGGAALVGFDAVTSRISGEQLAGSASFRATLARTSLQGAIAFFPFGSGWGTYDLAYQQFQPASIAGYANHAHQDYVEMLMEGGIFFLALATAFVWLAGKRAHLLINMARRDRKLNREAMASAVCGLGLLGFLLHSLVEFNMRIPANAILAALLAGVYLRPLSHKQRSSSHQDDRFAQSHPAGY